MLLAFYSPLLRFIQIKKTRGAPLRARISLRLNAPEDLIIPTPTLSPLTPHYHGGDLRARLSGRGKASLSPPVSPRPLVSSLV
jgi:hypothetical protein